MAGPWEKFQTTPAPQTPDPVTAPPVDVTTAAPESGPWSKFAKPATATQPPTEPATGPAPKSAGLLADMGISEDDIKHVAHGVFTGLADLPETMSYALRPGALAMRRVDQALGVPAKPTLDASGQLQRAGVLEAQPTDTRARAAYDFGRNLGSTAPFAPVIGPVATIMGPLGSTVAGETTHAAFPNSPDAETAASIAGGAAATIAQPSVSASGRALSATVRPLSQGGREAVVGQALNRAAGEPPPASVAAPIDTMPQTLGQSTNSPGLLALEKTVAKGGPENQAQFLTLKSDANRAIIAKARELSSGQTMEHANASVRTALDNALNASNARESQLWEGIDPHGTVEVPTGMLRETVAQFEQGLPVADQGTIPKWIEEVTQRLEGRNADDAATTLREVIAFDKRLGRAVRGATDPQEKFILGGLQRSLRNRLSDSELPIEDPGAVARWTEARAFTRNQKEIFDNNPSVGRTIPSLRTGQSAVPESGLLAHFVRTNGGSAEAIDGLLAASDTPQVRQAARDYLIDRMLSRGNKAELDQASQPMQNDVHLRDFITKYDAPLRRVFNSGERALIGKLAKAAEVMNRTTRAGYKGGSDTYSMFSGSKFVDNILMHTLLSEKGGPLAAGGAGYYFAGPAGAAAAVGGQLAARAAFTRAQESIDQLMRAALTNPELGRTLMMNASRRNLEVVSPAVRDYLGQFVAGVVPAANRPMLPPPGAPQPAQRDQKGQPQQTATNQAGMTPQAPAKPKGPPVGTIVNGYRFAGGDPNDQRAWEPTN